MSEDETKLESQLREATAPRRGGTADSDAETAGLAEGWMALGQLLEAANADFRPESVVKQIRRRLLRERLWRGAALLAAALLIGVGITWYANRDAALNNAAVNDQPGLPRNGPNTIVAHQGEENRGTDKAMPETEKPTAVVRSSDTPAAGPTNASEAPIAVASGAASNSGWDQTLDQQISQADQTVRSAETLISRGDEQIDQLDRELVSFRQEVEADSL